MIDHMIKHGVRVDLTKAQADKIRADGQPDMAVKKRIAAGIRKQQLLQVEIDKLISVHAASIDVLVNDAAKTEIDIQNYGK